VEGFRQPGKTLVDGLPGGGGEIHVIVDVVPESPYSAKTFNMSPLQDRTGQHYLPVPPTADVSLKPKPCARKNCDSEKLCNPSSTRESIIYHQHAKTKTKKEKKKLTHGLLVRLEDVLGGKLVLARKVDKVFKRTLCGFRLLRGFDGGAACRDVGE
jgi:hypothetical protein